MSAVLDAPPAPDRPAIDAVLPTPDRRSTDAGLPDGPPDGLERRQFGSSHDSGRPEVDEFSAAVDRYKLERRRRFITYEELFDVFASLGYERP